MSSESLHGRVSRKDIVRMIPEEVKARIVRGGLVKAEDIFWYAGRQEDSSNVSVEFSITPPDVKAELQHFTSENRERSFISRIANRLF